MTWDDFFMGLAQYVSQKSKDRSRKVGAVAVDQRNVVLSLGWNGFPRMVNDDVEERHLRPTKYLYVVHSESNLIANAAAKGVSLLGAKLYVNWYPCCDCSKLIIQAGFSEVICLEPDWNDKNWSEHFRTSRVLLCEARVAVRFMGKFEQKPT